MRRVTKTNILFWVNLQKPNRALSSRKCSIKASAKCKTSVYVLIDICLKWSIWLGPSYNLGCILVESWECTSCNIHFFEKFPQYDGRLPFFILLRRKSWEEIDFFFMKKTTIVKRGVVFSYLVMREAQAKCCCYLLCYGIIITSFQLNRE